MIRESVWPYACFHYSSANQPFVYSIKQYSSVLVFDHKNIGIHPCLVYLFFFWVDYIFLFLLVSIKFGKNCSQQLVLMSGLCWHGLHFEVPNKYVSANPLTVLSLWWHVHWRLPKFPKSSYLLAKGIVSKLPYTELSFSSIVLTGVSWPVKRHKKIISILLRLIISKERPCMDYSKMANKAS